jgi:hypothetical protein
MFYVFYICSVFPFCIFRMFHAFLFILCFPLRIGEIRLATLATTIDTGDESVTRRETVARALADRIATDLDWGVRCAAIRALVGLGEQGLQNSAVVVAALRDEDSDVRFAAVDALAGWPTIESGLTTHIQIKGQKCLGSRRIQKIIKQSAVAARRPSTVNKSQATSVCVLA